jgi:cysteine desulfurase
MAAIAGFALAAKRAKQEFPLWEEKKLWRDEFEEQLLLHAPHAVVHARLAPKRLLNTVCVSLPGMEAQLQVILCDRAGIAIGAGSACSSGRVGASHVMRAMQAPYAPDSIRISWGQQSEKEHLMRFLEVWSDYAKK